MIEGSLRDVPLSEVLQVIALGGKSGIFSAQKDEARARIYFQLGRIQLAHLQPGVHLGEILVRLDLLSVLEVQELLLSDTQDNAGTALGLAALYRALITQDDLRRALNMHVLEVIAELMLWKSGSFTFEETPPILSQVPTEHSLDSMKVLMEASRLIEDWRRGSVKPHEIYEAVADPMQADLSPEMREVLYLVDGRTTAANIALDLDMSEREVYSIMHEMNERKLIRLVHQTHEASTVMVVCPSLALQRLIRLMLQRTSVMPALVSNYEAAWSAIPEHRPQALIVDDHASLGWKFVRELRRRAGLSHLPVLLLTNEREPGGLFGLRRSRASVLNKPFQELELQQAVNKLLVR